MNKRLLTLFEKLLSRKMRTFQHVCVRANEVIIFKSFASLKLNTRKDSSRICKIVPKEGDIKEILLIIC